MPTIAPVAEESRADQCFDLGRMHRVCFGDATVVRERPALPFALPLGGVLRCDGSGDARECTVFPPRSFGCPTERERCIQEHPRMPDDGDWECADVDGVAICRSRSGAAGVAPGPAEPGWLCGEGALRICLDLAPDVPDGSTTECRYHHDETESRECTAGESPRLESPCADPTDCPPGMLCTTGVCVPSALPRPNCWTAADCEGGQACVLATCV